MDPKRLAQIRQHFTHPPSASCNREWALELCDEVERLWSRHGIPGLEHLGGAAQALVLGVPADHPVVIDDRAELRKLVDEQHHGGAASKPFPSASPATKKGKR